MQGRGAVHGRFNLEEGIALQGRFRAMGSCTEGFIGVSVQGRSRGGAVQGGIKGRTSCQLCAAPGLL